MKTDLGKVPYEVENLKMIGQLSVIGHLRAKSNWKWRRWTSVASCSSPANILFFNRSSNQNMDKLFLEQTGLFFTWRLDFWR